ncbi:MAG TPA: NADH-quinone oxidoreductase subunit N, partial [Myxococcaceae bacterium]|nr:NADH-quinone oxidoreductase subunit N [Myxococcaceae bacterium]
MLSLPQLTTADFTPLWPALILSAAACLVLLSEVFLSSASRSFQAPLAVGSTVLAGVVAAASSFSAPFEVFRGFAVQDPFGSLVSLVVCVGVGLASLLAPAFLRGRHAERGEFYALVLFGGAGMSLLGVSNELILLFINLEILSVATYALASYLRRGPRPAEAGFKYFILGAFSSAVLLYGTALLFGATQSTLLPQMSGMLARIFSDPVLADRRPLAYCGLALVGAGFGFKIAAVPFHMWTPDVYEGAPTPATAFFSVAPKVAALALFVRVMIYAFGELVDQWQQIIMAISVASMILGALAAINQRSIKRLMAYSSIGHVGYALIGLAAGTPAGVRGILIYMAIYIFMNIGTFAVILCMRREGRLVEGIDDLAGLARTQPMLAAA